MQTPQWLIDRHNKANAANNEIAQIDAQIDSLWDAVCDAVKAAVEGYESLGGRVASTGPGSDTIGVKVFAPREKTDQAREEVTIQIDRARRCIVASFASGRAPYECQISMGPDGKPTLQRSTRSAQAINAFCERVLGDAFYPPPPSSTKMP